MGGFRSLKVWQHAHQLVLRVYQETKHFPDDELYGLRGQMRRAAASIPSNLAEGLGRESRAELARFTRIAMGSASELSYQILLARDLGYLTEESHRDLSERIDHISRMLAKFVQTLRS
jgi:four helix bundle protein